MAITKKQKELDVMKWNESERLGKDACGSFEFCAFCDKALENPCDKASAKFNAANKEVAATTAKKAPAKKTTTTKKPATKKSAK